MGNINAHPLDDACLTERDSGRSAIARSWLLVAALSAIGFVILGGTLTSLGVYLPILQNEFGWSETEMGGGPMMLLLGMSVGNLLVGRILSTFGMRGLLFIGAFGTAAGWSGAALSRDLPMFMAAMAVTGLGAGIATIVPGIALITRAFDRNRGLAIGCFIGACALASSVVPPISGELIAVFGWRQACQIVAIAIASICLPLIFLVRVSGYRDETAPQPDLRHEQQKNELSVRQVAMLPAFWLLTLALTFSQFCMNGVLFSIVTLLVKSGFKHENAVAIYSATNLAALPGLFAGGALADRIGAKTVLPVVIAMQALGTFSLMGIGQPDALIAQLSTIGFMLFWGMAGGLPSQIGSMLLADLIGNRAFAAMLGVVFTVGGLSSALAPLATGWLFDRADSYALPIAIYGLLAMTAASLIPFVRRKQDSGVRQRPDAIHP